MLTSHLLRPCHSGACFIELTYCIHLQVAVLSDCMIKLTLWIDCFIELTDKFCWRPIYYGAVIVGCVLLSQHIVLTVKLLYWVDCSIKLTIKFCSRPTYYGPVIVGCLYWVNILYSLESCCIELTVLLSWHFELTIPFSWLLC